MSVRSRCRVLLAVAGAVLVAGGPPAAAAPALGSSDGIQVLEAKQLDARQYNVHLSTAALGRPVDVRILLPAGYDAQPRRRWPVVYLFHGTSGRASDWVTMGDAEKTTATSPFIVVMPDAGFDGDGGGWFTDWFNQGKGGAPRWETFHIGQLIPWIDHHLRTVRARRGRAIYGLSQGGFGSMSYAARHPDLFAAAGSFSGAVDTAADPEAEALVTPVVQATAFGLDRSPDPDAMFGPRLSQEINWAAHDPATLASNLRGMQLWISTRNGLPGPLDPAVPNPPASAIEAGVHELSSLFHQHLQALGIPSTYRDEGPGGHFWPYWARDFRGVVATLPGLFAHPPGAPATVAYRSADPVWSQWGWRVAIQRPAREFSVLTDADRDGFTLAGSGTATVRTPRLYAPRARLVVQIDERAGATRRLRLRADRRGRLTVPVVLGPGNPHQALTVGALLGGGTTVYATRVLVTSTST